LAALQARPFTDWVDSQICWALDVLGHAGLPGDHPFIKASLAELLRRQKADGGWTSEDGEAQSVSATVEALKVLQWYGRLEGSFG